TAASEHLVITVMRFQRGDPLTCSRYAEQASGAPPRLMRSALIWAKFSKELAWMLWSPTYKPWLAVMAVCRADAVSGEVPLLWCVQILLIWLLPPPPWPPLESLIFPLSLPARAPASSTSSIRRLAAARRSASLAAPASVSSPVSTDSHFCGTVSYR